MLTDILVPVPAAGTGAVYLKFLPRTADDYATVSAAASVRLENGVCRDVRLALGAVAPTPLRVRAAESLIEGQRPEEEALRSAAAAVKGEVDPVSDIRGSAEYKRDMSEVFVYRALRQAVERASGS